MTQAKLGSLLKHLRLEHKLTQLELASRLNESQSFVSKYESGEQRLDLIQLEAICKVLNVRLTALVERYLAR